MRAFLAVLVGLAIGPAVAQTPQDLRDMLCGQTVHVFYGPTGNQIEYLATDGTSFFWHSEFDHIIVGSWRLETSGTGHGAICFQYAENALRPGSSGEEFCLEGSWFLTTFLDGGLRRGDPYNLQSGVPPFTLPARPMMDIESLTDAYPDIAEENDCGVLLSS